MKSINNKLFENFKADKLSNTDNVIGGSSTATQEWVNVSTMCSTGLPIADLELESDIDSSGGGSTVNHYGINKEEIK